MEKIIAVLGDQSDCAVISRLLGRGFQVIQVQSPAEAVRREAKVLVCDADVPEVREWREVVALIARVNCEMSVVVCSRNADDRLWSEALNLGAYDVLAKPFRQEEVTRVLQNAADLRLAALVAV